VSRTGRPQPCVINDRRHVSYVRLRVRSVLFGSLGRGSAVAVGVGLVAADEGLTRTRLERVTRIELARQLHGDHARELGGPAVSPKTADEIPNTLGAYCRRINDSGH
jgi:hypothetical protein